MSPYLIAVDPGLSSGYMLVQTDPLEVLYSAELTMTEVGETLDRTLTDLSGKVDVVAERFIINAQTHKKTQAPFSLEVIGMMKWICFLHNVELDLQSSSGAKAQADNAALKRLGLWHKGGAGHANDAGRHVVHYLVRNGWKDKRLLGGEG